MSFFVGIIDISSLSFIGVFNTEPLVLEAACNFTFYFTGPYFLHSTLLVHLLLVLVTLLGDPAVGRVHVVLKQLVLAEGRRADRTLV